MKTSDVIDELIKNIEEKIERIEKINVPFYEGKKYAYSDILFILSMVKKRLEK